MPAFTECDCCHLRRCFLVGRIVNQQYPIDVKPTLVIDIGVSHKQCHFTGNRHVELTGPAHGESVNESIQTIEMFIALHMFHVNIRIHLRIDRINLIEERRQIRIVASVEVFTQ